MGVRLPSMISSAKQIFKLQSRITRDKPDVPKGHIAVYVGETQRKRFVVPISVLNHPSFNDLLKRAEEEFGFNHPMGEINEARVTKKVQIRDNSISEDVVMEINWFMDLMLVSRDFSFSECKWVTESCTPTSNLCLKPFN
ncbi:hypothetical protein Goklo_023615 [Gossypium klotzschianum]|uniref:Uncharacterized protein n=1 Tax=Gossypium klotzschianum TaxID=34286 RepID=A0A7J8TR53_9ROSI|nr:hypothetical protein [Gossypium klotzschianum]